ncbi:MAG: hypothetical protein IPL78_24795 [Chloroflexi bacterium]|nr:hypothetical protein [Chloroflexota bacterium]
MLHENKKDLSLDKKFPIEADYGDQPDIMGLWDVYFYDFRITSYGESQLVGQLGVARGVYQFEYAGSVDEIPNLLETLFHL